MSRYSILCIYIVEEIRVRIIFLYSCSTQSWNTRTTGANDYCYCQENSGSTKRSSQPINCADWYRTDGIISVSRRSLNGRCKYTAFQWKNKDLVSKLQIAVSFKQKIAAVVCVGFNLFTVDGKIGTTTNVRLMNLKTPVLFIVGQNATTAT